MDDAVSSPNVLKLNVMSPSAHESFNVESTWHGHHLSHINRTTNIVLKLKYEVMNNCMRNERFVYKNKLSVEGVGFDAHMLIFRVKRWILQELWQDAWCWLDTPDTYLILKYGRNLIHDKIKQLSWRLHNLGGNSTTTWPMYTQHAQRLYLKWLSAESRPYEEDMMKTIASRVLGFCVQSSWNTASIVQLNRSRFSTFST